MIREEYAEWNLSRKKRKKKAPPINIKIESLEILNKNTPPKIHFTESKAYLPELVNTIQISDDDKADTKTLSKEAFSPILSSMNSRNVQEDKTFPLSLCDDPLALYYRKQKHLIPLKKTRLKTKHSRNQDKTSLSTSNLKEWKISFKGDKSGVDSFGIAMLQSDTNPDVEYKTQVKINKANYGALDKYLTNLTRNRLHNILSSESMKMIKARPNFEVLETYFTPLNIEDQSVNMQKLRQNHTLRRVESLDGKMTLLARRQLIADILKIYLTHAEPSKIPYSVEEIMKYVDVYVDHNGKYIVKPKKEVPVPVTRTEPGPQVTKLAPIEPPKPVQRVTTPVTAVRKRRIVYVKSKKESKKLSEFDIKDLTSPEAFKLISECRKIVNYTQAHKKEDENNKHPINVAIELINAFMGILFRGRETSNKDTVLMSKIASFFRVGLSKEQLHDLFGKSKEHAGVVKEKLLKIFCSVINHQNGVKANAGKSSYKCYLGKGNNSPLVKSVLKQRWWWNTAKKKEIAECSFIWTQWRKSVYYQLLETSKKSEEGVGKIYNHLEFNYHLSNKKTLYQNLKEYYEKLGQDPFQSIPLTFHVGDDSKSNEYEQFVRTYNELKAKSDPNVWIIKPGEFSNRGNGIRLSKDLKEIREIIQAYERSCIIQKYISRPLLINKRKFDIRCYTLMTVINDSLKAYFYQEGYIRTSSSEFSLKALDNRLVHLTNDAIQIKSEDYGKFEPGNKLSYADLQKYLDSTYPDTDFKRDILPKMKELVIDTVKATFDKIYAKNGCNTVEIFGYDFMIDEKFDVYLIEVNTNPCLEVTSSLLARVVPGFLDNVFRIAIDPTFRPPETGKKPGINSEIKFELVFDEKVNSVLIK